MIITIAEIPEDGLDLDLSIPGSKFELNDTEGYLASEIKFRGQISKFSSGCIISGDLQGVWNLSCARCLASFDFPVTEFFRVFLTSEPMDDEDGIRESEEFDLDTSELLKDEIHLLNILREQLILQIPMKPICSETCHGLCPQCGINLNIETCKCEKAPIDPRLMKLKELKELMDK